MAVTLAEAKNNALEDYDPFVIDEFRKSSVILDSLIFDDAVNPAGGDRRPNPPPNSAPSTRNTRRAPPRPRSTAPHSPYSAAPSRSTESSRTSVRRDPTR